jgi:hypothetical protein
MNYALEQIGVVTTWLSLLFIAASVFGSICALGAPRGGAMVRPTARVRASNTLA